MPPESEKTLPTISVAAKRAKPKPKSATPVAGQTANPTAAAGPTQPAPVSGTPNVGSGGPGAPSLAASQLRVTGDELLARPVTRPGEIVEAAPGLVAIEHSDGGKANQYYLRGYNLDHGTDLATYVDDMPINMRTHIHGQGYTDLNWLMPETVNALDIRKGPYFADEGDFANAGSLHISLRDSVERTASFTFGSFGYERLFTMASTKTDQGTLMAAVEANAYNGPWDHPDDVRKINGLIRYAQGTATDGFSVTGMAYSNKWYATDQVPLRAITTGQIGLYGEIDPTDGGDVSRFSLSGRIAGTDDSGSWKANAYFIKSTLDLFDNFEWDTPNALTTAGVPFPTTNCWNAAACSPLYGDQAHQRDDRVLGGISASRTYKFTYAGIPTETTFGIQTRYDDINLTLVDSYQRMFLANILNDKVTEGSVGIYAENTIHWTSWYRTTLGWRGDAFEGTVNSTLDPANSGKAQAALGSPKASMTFGPVYKTELYLSAGMGFHSNDLRGATNTEQPIDRIANPGVAPPTLNTDPLLVRTRGAEVGVRTKAVQGLDSSVSVFILDQASELVFDGDTGTTSAGRPSERSGIEFTNDYRPTSWMHIDANLSLSRARFLGGYDYAQDAIYQSLTGYPAAQLGNAPGNYVYNSPSIVGSAGITLGDKLGWYGALRWRYIGVRPLTEDDAFKSPPFNIFNAQLGYRFENGWRLQLDILNLFNSNTDQASYAYGSLLKSDPLYALCNATTQPVPNAGVANLVAACQAGVTDRVLHPVEPFAVRATAAVKF